MTQRIAVFGGGGHAKVVIAALQACGFINIAVFDDDPSKRGTNILGAKVFGLTRELDAASFDAGVLAIGNNRSRNAVADVLKLKWLTVIHPAAYVHASVRLDEGTVVMAGAVIQPDTMIGRHAIINTGATVDHDCVLGDYVHIAPGTHLAGAVSVATGAFVGIGSSAIPGVKIGAWTTAGAGSVIVRDLPDNVTAFGVPARTRPSSGE